MTRREKTKFPDSEMKRDIASDPMEIKMIIKELYKPLYVNKLDNLNERSPRKTQFTKTDLGINKV